MEEGGRSGPPSMPSTLCLFTRLTHALSPPRMFHDLGDLPALDVISRPAARHLLDVVAPPPTGDFAATSRHVVTPLPLQTRRLASRPEAGAGAPREKPERPSLLNSNEALERSSETALGGLAFPGSRERLTRKPGIGAARAS
jgi:hypothetical protein